MCGLLLTLILTKQAHTHTHTHREKGQANSFPIYKHHTIASQAIMDFVVVALMAVAVQALTPEEIPAEIAPYAKIIGAIVMALGLLLGKFYLRNE